MTLLDRQIGFVEELRRAGMPVSLSEDLDAVRAVTCLPTLTREELRAALATTLVKRQVHRANFDLIFDLFYPAVIGDGVASFAGEFDALRGGSPPQSDKVTSKPVTFADDPQALTDFRARLEAALANNNPLNNLAREGVGRFGQMRGRGAGMSNWSAYSALHRINAAGLIDKLVAGLAQDTDNEPMARQEITRRVTRFTNAVEADARRRVAEDKGAAHMAQHSVRPSIDRLDFTSARKAEVEQMRREILPLARRLATRLSKEHHAKRKGALDFRRTVRASMQTGGVPITTHHKPKRPGRTELVILCDVSGSVANFASFTLMLTYALREQFTRVRAFTFVDDITEVTQHFTTGADLADTMATLAASAAQASLWGRTNYGRALTRFAEEFSDAVTPRTSLLILGDARSNYSDLAIPTLKQLAYDAKHTWWLNPEHPRSWNTGDSAAREYSAVVPMVECRNLRQLTEFIHDIC